MNEDESVNASGSRGPALDQVRGSTALAAAAELAGVNPTICSHSTTPPVHYSRLDSTARQ